MNALNSEIKELIPTIELESEPDPRGLGALITLVEGSECPLPLQEVKVRAMITGDCCRTVIEQRFTNKLDQVLEAIHIFPLPEDGAVVEMELKAGDVIVKAECREREEAEKIFQKARDEGHRAGLLTQERSDVHTLRVTNLPPKTDVSVRIIVLERLETVDGRLRWRFPTVIAPRYLPGEPIGHEGPGVLPDSDHAPDASRLQPPLRLEGGTSFDLEVKINGPIKELESSLHAVRIDLGQEGSEGVSVAPSGKATLDRDFILAFSTAEDEVAALRAYTDGKHTLVFVEPPSVKIPEPLPRDAVFIIDRSGSMSGPKMDAAKMALKSALHGLQEPDRFTLISFSNDTQAFSETLVDYNQENLEKADQWVDKIKAKGGTEMLSAVKQALAGDQNEDRVSTVLLITDGQVWNEGELVAAVGHRSKKVRFFTMGIGTAVSAALLKRMAKVGGGTSELLTPSDDIEAAVARLEARFGSPMAENVCVGGGTPADDRPRTLFMGRPISWLMEGLPKKVSVTGQTVEGELKLEVKPSEIDFPLGALWARDRISALEDRMTLNPHEEEALRPEILRIALEHGIASRFTAFVAVETSTKVSGERVEIVQPVELPQDWDKGFLGMPGADQMRGITLGTPSPQYMMASASGAMPKAAMDPGKLMRRREREDRKELLSHPSKKLETSLDSELARRQGADGSYGKDIYRTASALIALVLLGHTRRRGIRRRTVLKAVKWLEGHKQADVASMALDVVERAERGESPKEILHPLVVELQELFTAGDEGKMLRDVWNM